jgi:site-specific recombinase XerD
MVLRGLAPNTQEAYILAVLGLARYYNQSPAKLSNDQIQAYLLYLIKDRCLAWSSLNVAFSAMRCFYTQILKWDETRFHIPTRSRQKKRPRVLSIQETRRLLSVVTNPKHRALLMTVYGAGLRVSEVVRLKPHHIESDRMLIRVEQAKGRVDRYTILQERLLEELRIYWRVYRPGREWLFPGRDRNQPLSSATAQHCFASHMLEAGEDLDSIQRWMGHKSIVTTSGYLHVCKPRQRTAKSPLDELNLPSLLKQ